MRYFIEHLGDSILFYKQLEKNTKLERLRQEDSKERIILKNGGGIYVISAQSGNAKKSIESAMGEGAEIVILDEGGLIGDTTEATIYRMIAGKKDAFYCKIGNPFYNNHFKKSANNPKYKQILIDYEQAVAEGRYTQEFVDEARDKPLFDVLYECKFPPEDIIDDHGYRQLLTSADLKMADKEILLGEEAKLGCDIAGGGDYNVYVIRYPTYAFVVAFNRSNDTMVNVSEILRIQEMYNIRDENIFIDDIGIGRGVVDRLKEKEHNVIGVTAGNASRDKRFKIIKSEMYWALGQWVKDPENYLSVDQRWDQLTWIKYKVDSDSKVKTEPKADLKKRTGKSPDFAEALMLTFYTGSKQKAVLNIKNTLYSRHSV